MNDFIPADAAAQIAELMSSISAGPAFVVNRKIAQAFFEGIRVVHFRAGDLIEREESSSAPKRSLAERERLAESARRRLFEIAVKLEEQGYRINLDDGDSLRVSW